jgi:hypothetical protein
MQGWSRQPVIVLLVMFGVSAIHAAPTVHDERLILDSSLQNNCAPTLPEVVPDDFVVQSQHNTIAELGRQLLKPPSYNSTSAGNEHITVKALPPVPATILMTIVGFFCISLVRDRKVYLAAIAGLLWAGHAGINAIPQLADHIWRNVHTAKHHNNKLELSQLIADAFRTRPEIEGADFIALLHYLEGIPKGVSVPVNTKLLSASDKAYLSLCHSREGVNPDHVRQYRGGVNLAFAAILEERFIPNTLVNRPARFAERFICFSPAFIFEQLPRGPPALS